MARRCLPCAVALVACAMPAMAAMIEVTVTGIPDDRGQLGCSLHDRPAGYPTSGAVATDRVVPQGGQAVCRFDGVAPGRYAVAVMHDANGNGRLDTNLLGIPQEAWGISVGAAPRLRMPQFPEAAFEVGPEPVRLQIHLEP